MIIYIVCATPACGDSSTVRALIYHVLGSIPGKVFFLSLFHHPLPLLSSLLHFSLLHFSLLLFPPPFLSSFPSPLHAYSSKNICHGNAMTFDPKHCTYCTDLLANLNSHQLRVALLAALTQHDGEH